MPFQTMTKKRARFLLKDIWGEGRMMTPQEEREIDSSILWLKHERSRLDVLLRVAEIDYDWQYPIRSSGREIGHETNRLFFAAIDVDG